MREITIGESRYVARIVYAFNRDCSSVIDIPRIRLGTKVETRRFLPAKSSDPYTSFYYFFGVATSKGCIGGDDRQLSW